MAVGSTSMAGYVERFLYSLSAPVERSLAVMATLLYVMIINLQRCI